MDTNNELRISRAAVLGAGVMGAQIAAHLVNAGIETLLYELPGEGDEGNALVNKAIAGLRKLKPSPLATSSVADLLIPANYRDHLQQLQSCDLVIEAIAERMDWKKDLYEKVAPQLQENAIFASNTSGLGINELASVLPESLRPGFCGIHFFNPPRYMQLVEIIPQAATLPRVMDQLETFLTKTVGKGVVRAKDTPNFVGNRVGVFSMLSTMYHTRQFGLDFDLVDKLTGPAIGRPKSATYRTADVVGLDTMAHVVNNMRTGLEDDPWTQYFKAPNWLSGLIEQGALGQKTRLGVYRKQGKEIQVLDLNDGEYRKADARVSDSIGQILRLRNPEEKLKALRNSEAAEGQFLWAIFRDLFHYCAYHLADIAASAREVDQAVRWGYGWKQGPFEIWQGAGWRQVADWIAEDIAAGKAMCSAPLPDWVFDGRDGVHGAEGSWSPEQQTHLPASELPVYRRQLQPEHLLGEPSNQGLSIEENEAVRLWTLDEEVLILSFNTKMHIINDAVIAGINQAVDLAESNYQGLVIWQRSEPFCAGADLTGIAAMAEAGDSSGIDTMLDEFQQAVMRLKHSLAPTVAAVRGLALGGGCEILLHCQRVVAALESYIGLVEAGVGLLPGGGGLKEMAFRAVTNTTAGDSFPLLQKYYQSIAMGKVSASAEEARGMGFLRPQDLVLMNPHEILYAAIEQAKSMYRCGQRPAFRHQPSTAAGDVGIATLKMMLVNMLEGHFISPHDMEIGARIATVMCGGEIDRGAAVDQQWYLNLEREHFIALALQQKTQERIAHMLKTGKPLRN